MVKKRADKVFGKKPSDNIPPEARDIVNKGLMKAETEKSKKEAIKRLKEKQDSEKDS